VVKSVAKPGANRCQWPTLSSCIAEPQFF